MEKALDAAASKGDKVQPTASDYVAPVPALATHTQPRRRQRTRRAKRASDRRDYNYFRDYEAGTGRYVESDPIGLDGGVGTFRYVSDFPIGAIDSLGLKGDVFQIHKSCDGCVVGGRDFAAAIQEEVAWACDVFTLFLTPQNKFAKCIEKRCKSGKIKCRNGDTTRNCQDDDGSQNVLGYAFPLIGTANLCFKAFEDQSPRAIGSVVIHEWAHTCLWNHGKPPDPRLGGAGPKFNSSGFDGFPGAGDGINDILY